MLLEWCKQVVKCPRQDDIVIHAAQKGDDNHAKAYTCSKITHILGKRCHDNLRRFWDTRKLTFTQKENLKL